VRHHSGGSGILVDEFLTPTVGAAVRISAASDCVSSVHRRQSVGEDRTPGALLRTCHVHLAVEEKPLSVMTTRHILRERAGQSGPGFHGVQAPPNSPDLQHRSALKGFDLGSPEWSAPGAIARSAPTRAPHFLLPSDKVAV